MTGRKEIHFYEYDEHTAICSWDATKRALSMGLHKIHTLQMGLLSADLFNYGYRIFIHESKENWYEIKLGCENERTNRDIRVAHNLFKMWRAGEFSKNVNSNE